MFYHIYIYIYIYIGRLWDPYTSLPLRVIVRASRFAARVAKICQNRIFPENQIFPQKSGKSQLFVDFFHSLWNFAIIRWEPPGNTPGQPQTTHKPPWGASGGLRRSKWAKIGQNGIFPQKSGKSQLFVDFFHSLWNFAIIRWEPPGNTPGQPQTTHKPPWGASGGLRRSKWAKIGQNGIFPQKSGKSQLFVDFFHILWNFAIIRWEPPGITPGQPQITHKPPWRASGGQNRPK